MNSYENPTLSETCDLYSEIDRLQAINAELVAALEYYAAMKGPTGWPARNALEHHRDALSKAKES